MEHNTIPIQQPLRQMPTLLPPTQKLKMAGTKPRRSKRNHTAASPDAVPSSSKKMCLEEQASTLVTPEPVPSASVTAQRLRLEETDSSPIRPDAPVSSSLQVVKVLLPGKISAVKERPSPEECAYAVQELGKLHPGVIADTKEQRKRMGSCGMKENILDGVVNTMLSQNTTAANSTRAFANLKRAFPTWEKVVKLKTPTKLEEAIHCGGLAKIKAGRIMNICNILQEERGEPSLEYLRNLSNEEIQKDLMRFPGLGKKTVSCVLLFTLGRDEFPVDTHVHRISKQMKWIPPSFSRDDAYDYLNNVVPPPLKRDLHCLLIQHGRECHRCAARGKPQFPPKDGSKLPCPLVNIHPKVFGVKGMKIVVKEEPK